MLSFFYNKSVLKDFFLNYIHYFFLSKLLESGLSLQGKEVKKIQEKEKISKYK